jgi:hypothetical protein
LRGARRISSRHAFLVACRRGKKEGIFDLAALAPAIHTGEKFRKKMAGQRFLRRQRSSEPVSKASPSSL